MHAHEAADRPAPVHNEVARLVFLALVAVAAFFLTRAIAANNRDLTMRNAAEWYRRGEAYARAGDLDRAVDAYRRATVRNRDNNTYQLALARALVLQHDYDAARALLLGIRESEPDNPQINLDLARVAAAREDVTEALRFYHDALYAPWSPSDAEARRAVRLELIRFLMTHGQTARAWAEMLAAQADAPDQAKHGAVRK
jgi:tetratricopeptide (TPR) repeat protein